MELTIFNPQPFLYISIYVQCLQQQITSTFNSRFPFITAEQRQRQFIIKNSVMILSSMLHGTGFSIRLLRRWSQPAHKNLIRETASHKLILEHKSIKFSSIPKICEFPTSVRSPSPLTSSLANMLSALRTASSREKSFWKEWFAFGLDNYEP